MPSRSRRRLLAALLLVLVWIPLAAAARLTQSDLVLVRSDDVVTEDLYAAGNRIAIVCSGDDEVADGIYVADGGFGGTPELAVPGDEVAGSPTWIDEDRFVYTVTTETSAGQLRLHDTSTGSDTLLDLGTDRSCRAPATALSGCRRYPQEGATGFRGILNRITLHLSIGEAF